MEWLSGALGAPCLLDIVFAEGPRLPQTDGSQSLAVFASGDDVCGELKVSVPGGKKLEHIGVKIELKCIVEFLGRERTAAAVEVSSLVRDLAAPGTLSGLSSLRFIFPRAALEHETYSGANARVRYLARASVVRSGYTNAPVTRDADFVVRTLRPRAQPAPDSSVRLEVGIEDCLHIEFAYDRTVLGLTGVLTGHVDFLLVRVRIKNAEVSLVRREQAGPPGSAVTDNETLSRFEIMDGAPIKGERIPIRMYLGGLDVGPTQSAVGNVLSVKYFLNLVLVDEEDRRYFKQAELKLVREIAS